MAYLVGLYCLATAVSVVLALLTYKLLLAAFMTISAILALAVGDDLRWMMKHGNAMRKVVRAVMSVLMFVLALWLGTHFRINLYYGSLSGVLWCCLGALIAFAADQALVERRRKTRS